MAVTSIFISGRGSAISSAKQGKSGYIYNLVKNKISCLGHAKVRAFHENPNRIHTEVNLLTLKALNHKMYVFCLLFKYLKSRRQRVCTQIKLLQQEQSDLGPQCLPLC